jgi:hypothetical protein
MRAAYTAAKELSAEQGVDDRLAIGQKLQIALKGEETSAWVASDGRVILEQDGQYLAFKPEDMLAKAAALLYGKRASEPRPTLKSIVDDGSYKPAEYSMDTHNWNPETETFDSKDTDDAVI